MNIFVYPPAHAFGMKTLFQSTQREIAACGVQWDLAARVGETPQGAYAFAHLYSLPDVYSTFQNLLAARRAGLRVIATALYWNPTRYLTEGLAQAELSHADATAEREAKIRAAQLESERALLRVIYHACDVLIALSPSEADALVNDFGIARERIVIAWSGVETRYAQASPKLFHEKFGLRDFVLCVGRVDANKNQLNLIRALRDENVTLVLAGGSLAPHYLALCKRNAGANVYFLPSLSEAELASAYAAAHTHALVSWLEVIGLVTLEAAVAGCNIALTREHGARDYVGEAGAYCDAGDVESIHRAVLQAQRAPRQTKLREHLLETCSWSQHAQTIADAYAYAQTLPPLERDDTTFGEYEEAIRAFTALVPLLQNARDELWRDKMDIAAQRDAYANGRVMRVLNQLARLVKRGA